MSVGPQRLPPMRTGALSDGSGNATFEFPTVPSTHVRWGVLACPLAPPAASFTFYEAAAGGAAVSALWSWSGSGGAGPLLVGAMLTPIALASGLTPDTYFEMVWHGYEGDEGDYAQASLGSIFPAGGNTMVQTTPAGGSSVGGGLAGWAIGHATTLPISGAPPSGDPTFSGWVVDSFAGLAPTTDGTHWDFPAGAGTIAFDFEADLLFTGMAACYANIFVPASTPTPNTNTTAYVPDSTGNPQEATLRTRGLWVSSGPAQIIFDASANDFSAPIDVDASIAQGGAWAVEFLVFAAA